MIKNYGQRYTFPVMVWLTIFFVIPFSIILVGSFMGKGLYGGFEPVFSLDAYTAMFSATMRKVTVNTIFISVATTIITVLIAIPTAYHIARSRYKENLLFLVIIPFWTNFLIRTYAWLTILRTNTGLINVSLMSLGIIKEPLPTFGNDFSIVLGLVYGWLPDMVLPLYAALERMDRSLLEAASDLYAPGRSVFRRVIWPLSLPGVIAGSMLVFIPSLGAFVTPAILGGGKSLMIGNIISNQFLAAHDWPFGSALSTLMMILMLIGTLIYFRSTSREGAKT